MSSIPSGKLIRKKLMAAILITSTAGLVAMSLVFSSFIVISFKKNIERGMQSHARYTGTRCPPGLSQDDSRQAIAILKEQNSLSEFEATLRHGAFILFGGLSGALLATYFIARRFQRSICDPIESLSSSAKTIANTADFSQRTKVHAEDEIGQLAMNFNHMLTELQKRDAELRCNQTRFRTLIDEAMDAILIIQQNGIVVDFNPMAVSCLRDSRTGLLHRNISEIIPEFSPEKFQDLWRTTFAGTHPILKTDNAAEGPFQRPCRNQNS